MIYIGSKRRIFNQIEKLIKSLKLDKETYTFSDAFSGTTTVLIYFKDKYKIISKEKNIDFNILL